jgi:hypothetical protein
MGKKQSKKVRASTKTVNEKKRIARVIERTLRAGIHSMRTRGQSDKRIEARLVRDLAVMTTLFIYQAQSNLKKAA